jgi:hypothetical protein
VAAMLLWQTYEYAGEFILVSAFHLVAPDWSCIVTSLLHYFMTASWEPHTPTDDLHMAKGIKVGTRACMVQ